MKKYIILVAVLLATKAHSLYAQVSTEPTTAISAVDIPFGIDLKPVYAFANRFIDTLYTSEGYPNKWIEDGCDTRYMYRFVRGPLQFSAVNNVLYVKFTGKYGLRGSTRVCTALGNTPWTAPCSCGMGGEAPRRIDAGFVAQIQLVNNYDIILKAIVSDPQPLDKCSVCFFGKDVTQLVATQLKAELQASITEMQTMLKSTSIKPYVQQLWDTLQAGFAVPGFGTLYLNPQALRVSQLRLQKDSLLLSMGLSAQPQLSPITISQKKALPPLTDFGFKDGFNINIAQLFPYDSLDLLLNKQLAGKEFEFGKGLLKKKITVDSAHLTGNEQGILLKMYVSKGAQGVFTLKGTPAWDMQKQDIFFDNLSYDLQTDQWLLNTANIVMDKTITKKLQEATTISLVQHFADLKIQLDSLMNQQLYDGVFASGGVKAINLQTLKPAASGLYLAGSTSGQLRINVNLESMLKQF